MRGQLALAVAIVSMMSCGAVPIIDLGQEPVVEPLAPQEKIDYTRVLGTGFMLQDPDEGVGVHLQIPVRAAWTSFELGTLSLGDLASISVIPTAEAIMPIGDHWTLLPFAGIGAGLELGESQLVGDRPLVGLATAGVSLMRWDSLGQGYSSILRLGAHYNAALTSGDGLLGDWGDTDFVAELRREIAEPNEEGSRFEPGVYAQVVYYWAPIEIDVPGLSSEFVNNQLEFGISLGSTKPVKVFGVSLPRFFLGYRFGDDLKAFQLRFGRL